MSSFKHALPCECVGTCSVALVTAFEPIGDEPPAWYVDFYARAGHDSLRARARAAWRVLRGKDPWTHAISLSVEQAAELRDFIDEHLVPGSREQQNGGTP